MALSKTSALSCLTDKPLASTELDDLDARDYARALCRFIRNADTPVTIGIQGGWGSGKTSLITIMQENLEKEPDADEVNGENPTICVLVNAWEHSLFHGSENKAEVALSLLNGLARGVKEVVERASWLADKIKNDIVNEGAKVEGTLDKVKTGLGFLGKVALHATASYAGLKLPETGMDKNESDKASSAPLAENIKNLRLGLKTMIEKITYKGKPVRVVFFIDDLDRVPPPTAVEILDITKNIFDIPNCVFGLAIDYDVVVKGLEAKFGEKNEKNEREFRQYFDKIIQIPFTMPVGAYAKNVSRLMQIALVKLGYNLRPEDGEILENLADDARLATGGIPRSIKRIINTLSLLTHIDNARNLDKSPIADEGVPPELEARFIIIALHINFPEIARRLMSKPDFTKWNPQSLNLLWKLGYEKHKAELHDLDEDQFFNDPWEQVIYCLCAGSPWLKTQARNVSHLFNNLLKALEPSSNQLSKKSLDRLSHIMESIKVVSVDDENNEQEIVIDNSSVKTDPVSAFCKKLQYYLAKALPDGVMERYLTGHAAKSAEGERDFSVPLDNAEVYEFDVEFYPTTQKLFLIFYVKKSGVSRKAGTPALERIKGELAGKIEDECFWIGIVAEDVKSKDFESMDPRDYVPALVDAYQKAVQISKKLKSM